MFLQFGDVRDIPAAVVKIFGDPCCFLAIRVESDFGPIEI
jgi:hypothetical protein